MNQQTQKTCNKKAMEQQQMGCWSCGNGHNFRAPVFRYTLSMDLMDHTGSLKNVTVFDDVGAVIMGKSADEMKILSQQNQALFDQTISETRCKLWTVKVRSKMETWNDKENVKRSIIAAEPMDGRNYGKYALDALQEVRGMVGAF